MEKHPLHLKQPDLHTSPEVASAVTHEERKTDEKLPNEPGSRIEAYTKRLENIFLNPDEKVRKRNLEMFRDKIYDSLLIKPENFPESYFELQKRVARERGEPINEIAPDLRERMIDMAIGDQKASLDAWVDYLTSDDAVYPPWFKYLVWRNITKLSQFDKERGEFKKRTESTVAPFPDIYREPLAKMADLYEQIKNDNKKLKEPEVKAKFEKRFPVLYAELIQESLASQIEHKENTAGAWVKYEQGKPEEAERLYKSLENKGTGWCTAGKLTADTQIQAGDFYVYYTNDDQGTPSQPRLAIRMNGKSKIAEVRGILPHQNVEPIMQEVLETKLKEFGSEAKAYRKKSADMKRLTDLDEKAKQNQPFTKDDLSFLYELNSPITGFGYYSDPRIEELKKNRSPRLDLAYVKDLQPEQISLTEEGALQGNIKFHYGEINLVYTTIPAERLKLPEQVAGSVYLDYTSADGLKLPNYVGRDLWLRNLTSADGLKLPDHIGNSLDLGGLTSADGLKLPDQIGGSLSLGSLTSAEGLKLPDQVGGDLDLRCLISAKGLKLPDRIGGSLDLSHLTSAEGLKLPDNIGGPISLRPATLDEKDRLIGQYPNLKFLFKIF